MPTHVTSSGRRSAPDPKDAATRQGGPIGQPMPRVDGLIKATGRAPFAGEAQPGDAQVLYGLAVTSPVDLGSITALHTAAAEAAPGVVAVLTHLNMPKGYAGGAALAAALAADLLAEPVLSGQFIDHFGQPIACVVADTLEHAEAAARLVQADITRTAAARTSLRAAQYDAPKPVGGPPPDTDRGDFEANFRNAALRVDETYGTPAYSQATLEPPTTLAMWQGDSLTLHCAHQIVDDARQAIAALFDLDPARVEVIAPYIGGGFGLKRLVLADAMLAAAAARITGRPVKVALSRRQTFNAASHRSATIQWVQLGADRDGVLRAVSHRSWSGNLPARGFYEQAAAQTRHLYATPNLLIEQRNAVLNLPLAATMRAPGVAVGLLALESAMDQLAELGQIDPVELRLRNDPRADPETGKPFSEHRLGDCLRLGAERFGWSRRTAPGQRSEGRWLVGLGMACAFREHLQRPCAARVTLSGDGRLLVATSMTDPGTGTATILTQIAAELLGLEPGAIDVRLGDTDLPASPGSDASWGASSAGSAVFDACMTLRARLAHEAGLDPARAVFANGAIGTGRHARKLGRLVRRGSLVVDGSAGADMGGACFAASTGAVFAEVGVDRDSGEIRVRRMLGVFDIGRVLNPLTTRSQLVGGMALGIGGALTENLVVDTRAGAFINHDLGSYLIPTHADIPAIEAVTLDRPDEHTNPLKMRGAAELGVGAAGAAVANAVHNACGARVRDYPITLDKILDHLGDHPG